MGRILYYNFIHMGRAEYHPFETSTKSDGVRQEEVKNTKISGPGAHAVEILSGVYRILMDRRTKKFE